MIKLNHKFHKYHYLYDFKWMYLRLPAYLLPPPLGWDGCPQVLLYAPRPHVTVHTCPLEGSAFAGRDGCPQPSVRRESYAPPAIP